jgi:hypothetical protein
MGLCTPREAGRGPPLNQFTPLTEYLRRRLRRTSFEDVETYKQILLLERLTFTPLRDWRGEVVFLGLCAMFPAEAQILMREVRCEGAGNVSPSTICLDWREFTRPRNDDQRQLFWRERIAWLQAGGKL